jgi:hypothetical protein
VPRLGSPPPRGEALLQRTFGVQVDRDHGAIGTELHSAPGELKAARDRDLAHIAADHALREAGLEHPRLAIPAVEQPAALLRCEPVREPRTAEPRAPEGRREHGCGPAPRAAILASPHRTPPQGASPSTVSAASFDRPLCRVETRWMTRVRQSIHERAS